MTPNWSGRAHPWPRSRQPLSDAPNDTPQASRVLRRARAGSFRRLTWDFSISSTAYRTHRAANLSQQAAPSQQAAAGCLRSRWRCWDCLPTRRSRAALSAISSAAVSRRLPGVPAVGAPAGADSPGAGGLGDILGGLLGGGQAAPAGGAGRAAAPGGGGLADILGGLLGGGAGGARPGGGSSDAEDWAACSAAAQRVAC